MKQYGVCFSNMTEMILTLRCLWLFFFSFLYKAVLFVKEVQHFQAFALSCTSFILLCAYDSYFLDIFAVFTDRK